MRQEVPYCLIVDVGEIERTHLIERTDLIERTLSAVADRAAGGAQSHRTGEPVASSGDRRRAVVVGAARCVARFGIAATTIDDIAAAAGCSRATVYRLFPGGREAVLAAVADSEVQRCLVGVADAVQRCDTLAEALVAALTVAGQAVAQHPLLERLLHDEPDVLLPLLTFEHQERILRFVGRWTVHQLARWLDAATARRVGEWAARVVAVYGLDPTTRAKLADPGWVRHMVDSYLLPGVRAMERQAPGGRPAHSRAQQTIAGGNDMGTDTREEELCHDRSYA